MELKNSLDASTEDLNKQKKEPMNLKISELRLSGLGHRKKKKERKKINRSQKSMGPPQVYQPQVYQHQVYQPQVSQPQVYQHMFHIVMKFQPEQLGKKGHKRHSGCKERSKPTCIQRHDLYRKSYRLHIELLKLIKNSEMLRVQDQYTKICCISSIYWQ